ncbi:hypothetical protein HDU67_004523, partial [Dinochytrium kinnereticum]
MEPTPVVVMPFNATPTIMPVEQKIKDTISPPTYEASSAGSDLQDDQDRASELQRKETIDSITSIQQDPSAWRYRPISIQPSNGSAAINPSTAMVGSVMRKAGMEAKNASRMFFDDDEEEAARLEYLALSPDGEDEMDEFYLRQEGEGEGPRGEFDESDAESIAILKSLRRNATGSSSSPTIDLEEQDRSKTPTPTTRPATESLTPPTTPPESIPGSVNHLPPLPDSISSPSISSSEEHAESMPPTPVLQQQTSQRNSNIYPTPSLTPSPANTLAAPTPAPSPVSVWGGAIRGGDVAVGVSFGDVEPSSSLNAQELRS